MWFYVFKKHNYFDYSYQIWGNQIVSFVLSYFSEKLYFGKTFELRDKSKLSTEIQLL